MFIAEEEIPRAGIRIVRITQLAREPTKGSILTWNGRIKRVDQPQPSSKIAFDQLVEINGNFQNEILF